MRLPFYYRWYLFLNEITSLKFSETFNLVRPYLSLLNSRSNTHLPNAAFEINRQHLVC